MVARFYGFTDSEINKMLYCDYQDYVRAIPILRAQESLEQITISSYPHSKEDHQKKVHRELHKLANPDVWASHKKPMTLEELAKVVGRG